MVEQKKVSINRVNPNGLLPIHSNDFMINHNVNEVYITFYQLEPPYIETEQEFKTTDVVNSIVVGKIVLTPEGTRTLMRVLKQNMEKYEKNLKKYQEDLRELSKND